MCVLVNYKLTFHLILIFVCKQFKYSFVMYNIAEYVYIFTE